MSCLKQRRETRDRFSVRRQKCPSWLDVVADHARHSIVKLLKYLFEDVCLRPVIRFDRVQILFGADAVWMNLFPVTQQFSQCKNVPILLACAMRRNNEVAKVETAEIVV
jgi:hypothetical protein